MIASKSTLLAGLAFIALGSMSFAQEFSRPVRIVASVYPMYIATLNVVKDVPGVELVNLTKPQTGCLHDYQVTTEDILTLSKADIFVVNGAGMEAFMDKVVRQSPGLKVVDASEGIELLDGNAHVWTSPTLHIRQVRNIAEGLARCDAARAEVYRRNADEYVRKLEALREKMQEGLRDIQSRDIITFHETFPYFVQEFGLNIAGVIEREPGSEPSARELAETIGIVKDKGVKALFAEPQYPAKSAEAIARETGASVHTLDPVVTGPLTTDAYIEAMERNLAVLRQALR